MTDTLALLHSLDWKKIGLEGFFRGANFLERQVRLNVSLGYVSRRAQVSIWGQQYFLASTIGVCPALCALFSQYCVAPPIPAMDKLLKWLPANIPNYNESVITHGDYRLDNMIFHPTEVRCRRASSARTRGVSS